MNLEKSSCKLNFLQKFMIGMLIGIPLGPICFSISNSNIDWFGTKERQRIEAIQRVEAHIMNYHDKRLEDLEEKLSKIFEENK